MVNINFVPNEYIEQRESNKSNIMYLFLLAVFMAAIAATFSFIKIRQKAVSTELAVLNSKMENAQGQLAQLDELRTKAATMIRTADLTTELIEPVPKSIILACLTNNLPSGVSLLRFNLTEKEIKMSSVSPAASQSKYVAATAAATANESPVRNKKTYETNIKIEGIAPNDIEVAAYISNLNQSIMLDNIELVESKEREIDDIQFRHFKLSMHIDKGFDARLFEVADVKIVE